MMKIFNTKSGFSLTEIMSAALIIVLSAAGTYSAFLLSRQFSERFKHRTLAHNYAAALTDELRYRNSYNDDGAGEPLEIGTHTFTAQQINQRIKELQQETNDAKIEYTVSNVWLGNDGNEYDVYSGEEAIMPQPPAPPRPAFKKIVVKVSWNERKVQ